MKKNTIFKKKKKEIKKDYNVIASEFLFIFYFVFLKNDYIKEKFGQSCAFIMPHILY